MLKGLDEFVAATFRVSGSYAHYAGLLEDDGLVKELPTEKQSQRRYAMAQARLAAGLLEHGKYTTYKVGCSCDSCREAYNAYMRELAVRNGGWRKKRRRSTDDNELDSELDSVVDNSRANG